MPTVADSVLPIASAGAGHAMGAKAGQRTGATAQRDATKGAHRHTHQASHTGVLAKGQAAQPPATEPASTHTTSRSARSVAVLALQARVLRHDRLTDATSAMADELARLLGAQRVSIGLLQGGRCKVSAMSHTDDVAQHQQLVRIMGAAMDEAVLQRSAVQLPAPKGQGGLTPRAHRSLAELNGQVPTFTLPLYSVAAEGAEPLPFGALLIERVDGVDEALRSAAQDVATFVGPILALKRRLDQPVSGRLMDAVAPRAGSPARSARRRWLLIGSVALLLGVGLWPVTFQVVAPARVEGRGQQVLAAPFDGFVRAAPLRPGAAVRAGQVLLQLDDRDLTLEQARWQAEAAQLDKRYREAQTTGDAALSVVARSRLEQAQAQLALASAQLARTRLVAPFDGLLLSGDFSQQIGSPVQRGQSLLTLVPDGQWHVVAEVDEQDVARTQPQQLGRMLVGALDGDAVELQVTRVAPVASVVDGRNVFEVDAHLIAPPAALRPGLRGVVRLDVDTRMQAWVWWHGAAQWWRRTLWRLWG